MMRRGLLPLSASLHSVGCLIISPVFNRSVTYPRQGHTQLSIERKPSSCLARRVCRARQLPFPILHRKSPFVPAHATTTTVTQQPYLCLRWLSSSYLFGAGTARRCMELWNCRPILVGTDCSELRGDMNLSTLEGDRLRAREEKLALI